MRGSLLLPWSMITSGTDFGAAFKALSGTYSYRKDGPMGSSSVTASYRIPNSSYIT